MLDNARHRVILIEILKDIYTDPELRTALGFKGGSAAMLFYGLPRFSVDLDFDLLKGEKKSLVFEKVKTIIEKYGTLREAREKRFTLFYVLSYEKGENTVKVDISKRDTLSSFEPRSYLGISMLVMKPEDMLAGKLSALFTRRKLAMRDVFDTWYFLKNKWPVNQEIFQARTGLTLEEGLDKAIELVSGISRRSILQGLGELLDQSQKDWARDKLMEEVVFYLRLLREAQG